MSDLGFSVVSFFFFPFFFFFYFFLLFLLGLALKYDLCVQGLVEDPNLLSCRLYMWKEAGKGLRYFPSKKRGKTKQGKQRAKGRSCWLGATLNGLVVLQRSGPN